MEILLRLLMAKRRDHSGFTMLEMLLTLFLVSSIILISVPHIPEYWHSSTEDELKNLSYLYQGAQMNALAKNQSFTVFMNYDKQTVEVRNRERHLVSHYSLTACRLEDYGLKQFTYRNNGDTSAFGTVYLSCDKDSVKFIFQILKGRFRIES